MRWWAKCISMVIAKTASRNVAFKTDVMSQAVLEAQASSVTPEATDQEASSERCALDDGDVERNADLYVFNHEVAHGELFIRLAMRRLRDICVRLRFGVFV